MRVCYIINKVYKVKFDNKRYFYWLVCSVTFCNTRSDTFRDSSCRTANYLDQLMRNPVYEHYI